MTPKQIAKRNLNDVRDSISKGHVFVQIGCDELEELTAAYLKAIKTIKQCRVYSECYDELMMTIDSFLREMGES